MSPGLLHSFSSISSFSISISLVPAPIAVVSRPSSSSRPPLSNESSSVRIGWVLVEPSSFPFLLRFSGFSPLRLNRSPSFLLRSLSFYTRSLPLLSLFLSIPFTCFDSAGLRRYRICTPVLLLPGHSPSLLGDHLAGVFTPLVLYSSSIAY